MCMALLPLQYSECSEMHGELDFIIHETPSKHVVKIE